MAAPIPNGGRVIHINGTASTTAAKTTLQASESAHLTIANTDATNNLLVSFDEDKTYFTIRPNTFLQGPFKADKYVFVKSSAATVAYNILWTTSNF